MEPIAFDRDVVLKKQIFEVILFLELMKTASTGFPPELRKEFEATPLAAAAQELKKVVSHVMRTGDRLVPDDPDRRG